MKDVVPILLMGCLFVLTYGLALAVIPAFEAAGVSVYENPNDPLNVLYFFLTLLLVTAALLLIAKFWKKRLVQVVVLGSIAYITFYLFYILSYLVLPDTHSLALSVASVIAIMVLLVKYPEWYVIDVAGVLLGLASIAMLGISLGIYLVILLLMGLSIYDAISVYKTRHMIDLADVVLDLRLPVMLVIPKKRGYSMIGDERSLKEKLQRGEERDAFFMGLGDIVMPGILVASVFHNIGDGGIIVAFSVILGILIGFAVLLVLLVQGRPQAGLPFLCGGAILGYLLSSYALFGELVGLMIGF
jgi:presenilin-like A22 family membrane protease